MRGKLLAPSARNDWPWDSWYSAAAAPRGEIVITIAPPGDAPAADAATLDAALAAALAGSSVKSAVAMVSR